MLNVADIKKDFPILRDASLVYLDSAASSQKPQVVIDAITDYYTNHNANVHRGVYTLSETASDMYEAVRKKVSKFIGAAVTDEVVFTLNATDSINTVAFGWGLDNLTEGDEILIDASQHHANLVPWQHVAERTGATLVFFDNTAFFEEKLSERTKLVSMSHASNVTGAISPIKDMIKLAKKFNVVTVVDGAQAAPHIKVNMQSLGCDFYAFSAHKMLGPTGVGVLWGRLDLLNQMNPYRFGGGMIATVTETSATWAKVPEKFEAGTPNIAGVVGFGAAIDYLERIGMQNIREHEVELNKYALSTIPAVVGPSNPEERTGLVTFSVDGVHAHDIAAVLSAENICVRAGHHCAMPLHTKLNLAATTRASYYLYNSKEDIDKLAIAIEKAKKLLK